MTVLVFHTLSAVLKVKGGHLLSPQRFLKYQTVLVEQDDVEIVVTNTVNPASFLSGNMGEPVVHECLEAIKATYSSCPDLKDTLPENTETWSTDGSSCVISGRHAGYVVTMSREVIESGPLPTNTSLPENVAIMHIKAHQKVSSELEEEDKLVGRKAKETAKGEVTVETVEAALIPDEQISIEGTYCIPPTYQGKLDYCSRNIACAYGDELNFSCPIIETPRIKEKKKKIRKKEIFDCNAS
ncbi:hypothetical protein DUI87_32246 [Hirundo rustica rustica]|uniref:RNase H type-1 domain-containing protein n=1 Tax=Hirundo rustica rustica TaxID=333673 RepID=A0A3M0IRJ4_HIRRU|nr:hypothetical protein DUI87_32246 [Hirundo rustica rustica]